MSSRQQHAVQRATDHRHLTMESATTGLIGPGENRGGIKNQHDMVKRIMEHYLSYTRANTAEAKVGRWVDKWKQMQGGLRIELCTWLGVSGGCEK